MTSDQRRQLDQAGYLLLPDFMSPALLDELRREFDRLLAEEGEHAGREFRIEPHTKRLANLVDKGEVFRRIITLPEILACIGHIITEPFKLSSLNARTPEPHSDWVQPLHCDAAAIKDARGFWVANVIWMLDDFTAQNGATRIVPSSHHWGKLPQEALADPSAPHPDEVLLVGKAGSVAIINAHAWHGGTANRSGGPRRAIHAFYTRWDKPQQQFQRALLSERTVAGLSPELRRLLAIDDPLNEQLSLADPLRSGFLK